MHLETLAVHAGRKADATTGAVTAPIVLSTTYEREADGTYPRGFSYSREDNPNRRDLEACLAALEGGTQALCFASGLAAVTAVFQAMEPGDHVIAPEVVYYGVKKVAGEVFGKWPLEVTWLDTTNLDAVRAATRPATRLIWVETPANPLLTVTDLAGIAEIARTARAMTVCDGTFATPVLQRPLDCGIDVVMHSTTKYLSGHSDVVGGALIARYDSYLFERARRAQRYGGAVPSPFDCWLARRGVDTVVLRVRTQSENAGRVAAFLEAHPRVEKVHYPGLASHPQHATAARQMTGGFGGMVSFEVAGGREPAMRVAARTRIFTRATSLGGTHSLIEHRASIEGHYSRTPEGLLRLSVGIENSGDLIADLAQALEGID